MVRAIADHAGSLTLPHPAQLTLTRSPRHDEQRLSAPGHHPGVVAQHRRRQPRAAGRDRRRGVEADPLAPRLAEDVDGELGVDVEPAVEREDAGDAVARVRHGEHALEAGGVLALDDRHAQARPHRRRPRLVPAAGGEAQLDRVAVAEALERRRRGGLRRARRGRAVRGGRGRVRRLDAPRAHGHHRLGARRQLSLEQLHRAARPDHARGDRDLPDRHRPQDLEREPGEQHPRARLAALERPPEQRRGRPRMLVSRIPRPARVRRRREPPVPEPDEERIWLPSLLTQPPLTFVGLAAPVGRVSGHERNAPPADADGPATAPASINAWISSAE